MTRCVPVRREDPAGLDKLLLAVAQAGARWAEQKAAALGVTLNLWDGENGLQSVVVDAIKQHGIPNKRFQELVTPRLVAENVGVLKRKRRLAR